MYVKKKKRFFLYVRRGKAVDDVCDLSHKKLIFISRQKSAKGIFHFSYELKVFGYRKKKDFFIIDLE